MRRGKESAKLPRESVLKIDKDCRIESDLEKEHIQLVITTLRKYHLKVEWIKATRTQHGRHYYIKVDSAVYGHVANGLQYLLGDDPKRVAYNEGRIKSGLVEWNKLFEVPHVRLRTVYR